ncbi:uncharacterized protein [Diadema antillarum]|uniref:uncharacterized protein n=1 Tax=Diadema antillarum TaxID=105358 RepID=UPI003A879745
MGKENDLLEAARTGNVVTIGKLLSSGRGRNVLSQALSFRRALGPNCQDTSGYTPLHHAVLNGHRDAIQMLLKFDASPTVADNRGSNPLHLAAWTGNMDIVQTLLTVGVSKDQVNEQNNYLDTPLHFAAQYGHTQVVSILLDHGADPTLCNRKEEGPLDLAAQYGRLDTVQLLVRLRPDLLSKVPDSRSLLHLAAKNGHHRIVKLLLEAGCDINKTTKNGTALHEAAVFGKIEVVRVLLEHRQSIDVEIADSHSETALQKIESHSSKVSQDISKMIMGESALVWGNLKGVHNHVADYGDHITDPYRGPDTAVNWACDFRIKAIFIPKICQTALSLHCQTMLIKSSHIRGEPLPSAVESSVSPLYSDGEHRGSNPSLGPGYDGGLRPSHSPTHSTPDDADMSHNIYDNVPNDGAYLRHYLHQELRAFHSSPPTGQRVLKPLRSHVPPAGGGGDGDGGGGELYMNVNQIPLLRNAGPPKKPQRNSIGILLDQIYDDEGSQVEFHTDVHQQPENRLPLPGSGPTHLEVKGPQYSLSNTLSSQDSDSPPPLPDRNYYDVDQAGEYTQLRRDAPPPKPQKHRETDYSPPQPDYDAMNEGPGNTSTDASEEGRGSIYEVLSTAKSGSPIHGSDYPAPPHHVSIQLHINEPEDDLSLTDVNTTCEGEYNLDHEDDQDLDAYELLSEAMTGGSPSKGRPKPKPRITPTSSSASSVPSTESASPLHKPVPLPRRGKPVPAKRSPGSISSQPSTPSEELTSSTASEHWEGRGGGALERPGTPDQPPPSPNTAMMGIHAKLSASESILDANSTASYSEERIGGDPK